ncbi:MAG: hypothetical protein PHE29_06320 [Tissierellia bacterium]|nr:hypothetical protein [Tissierellia bacterium]MDD4781595.1 hypothetical protein [Tissierellia bacterium]
MKNKIVLIISITLIMVLMSSTYTNIFAEDYFVEKSIEIRPYYTSIILCANNLKLNSNGNLSCEGQTSVRNEFISGVKMELQQLSNTDDWTTIKTWESISDDSEAYLYKNWYVVKGSYRLKLTHNAINSSGNTVETVIKYSKTVIY